MVFVPQARQLNRANILWGVQQQKLKACIHSFADAVSFGRASSLPIKTSLEYIPLYFPYNFHILDSYGETQHSYVSRRQPQNSVWTLLLKVFSNSTTHVFIFLSKTSLPSPFIKNFCFRQCVFHLIVTDLNFKIKLFSPRISRHFVARATAPVVY